ncbi:hypothetical protein HW555_002396 [Spodoptera exigua]|uniref:Uncharacterized protein n=1 Tax=Spodoptera exigua TaxID=7107 RepID=A0A835GND6_SPOEX|nr:hypothetical protein HW555_002396 [Spodoptera exigua]
MVNNYKRKSNRNSWDEASMKNAIEKVAAGEMGLNKASHQFLPSTSKASQPSPPVLSTEDLQPLVSRDNQPSTSRANEAANDVENISASTTPSIEDID